MIHAIKLKAQSAKEKMANHYYGGLAMLSVSALSVLPAEVYAAEGTEDNTTKFFNWLMGILKLIGQLLLVAALVYGVFVIIKAVIGKMSDRPPENFATQLMGGFALAAIGLGLLTLILADAKVTSTDGFTAPKFGG